MSNKVKRESYRVKGKWVPHSEMKSIYPASDRSRNISNVNRVLGRCLEVNLGAEDVNFLYDTVGLCRVDRKHALYGHKQVGFSKNFSYQKSVKLLIIFQDCYWHGKISRFHNDDRRIAESLGPDKVIGETLTGRGHPSFEQRYLRDLVMPAPAHFSPSFLEDWNNYRARIDWYERRYLICLKNRVVLPIENLSAALMVRKLF